MKKGAIIIAAAFAMSICGFARSAMAVDLGASITGGYSGTINTEKHEHHRGDDNKVRDGYKLGINLVADTILDKNQLMNLRIGIGYLNGMYPGDRMKDIDFFSTHSLHSIMWTNTLGFGIIKKDNFRFWIGPQLSMSFDFQKRWKGYPPMMHPRHGSDDYRKAMFGYLGLVAGVNYSPVNNFFLTAEAGFRAGYGGTLDKPKMEMAKLEPFVNCGFLYRINTGGKSSE